MSATRAEDLPVYQAIEAKETTKALRRMVDRRAGTKLGRSRSTAGSGFKSPIPQDVWPILDRAWEMPFSVSSNYARENALAVAFAASLGWITTITLDGLEFSRRWHLTQQGAAALQSREKLSP